MSILDKKEFKEIIYVIIEEFKLSCDNFLKLNSYKFSSHTDFISNLII